jgi:hypothetical protein
MGISRFGAYFNLYSTSGAKKLLGAVILLFCISCEKKDIFKYEGVQELAVTHFPGDIAIPSVVWDLLEGKSTISYSGKIVHQELARAKFEENIFVGIRLRLIEKTPGVLGGRSFEIKAQRGGLNLDLAKYIKGDRGTFIMSFRPDVDVSPEKTKVYFVSRSRKRKNMGQILGSACNTFFDITDYYLKTMITEGMEVNVTDNRHISLLSGHFVMLASQDGLVRALTQVSFSDSTHNELICEKKDQSVEEATE